MFQHVGEGDGTVSWQQSRPIEVSSPLGENALLFQRMVATEQLGHPFAIDLDLLSEDHGITLEKVLGQTFTVRCELPRGGVRHFSGLVSEFRYAGTSGRYASYQCRLSPWLWFLSRASNCRIFQHKTVPDILKQVFDDRGFSDYDRSKLSGSYPQRVYCVQYRESDLDFVSRLMEHEGIHYYFRHAKDKHTLVLFDDNANLDENADYAEVPFYPPEDARYRERDHVSAWAISGEVQPGTVVLRDFDFEKPSANMEARLSRPHGHAHAAMEVYDYPGDYTQKADGDGLSRLRLEQREVGYEQAHGQGDVAGLSPGCLFKLTGHPRDDYNREYVLVSASQQVSAEGYESGAGPAKSEVTWASTLTAIDKRTPSRSRRLTPRPIVSGPQTAIVTGPAGEEIWTDNYGRVKVQFHWDREGQYDENSSCWVRVSHPWAGKGWGAVSIPRIGQEVIVEFLEGDPDRPIITGRVYNAESMPPYGLPAGAVQSGIKSDSTKGGGGYNEYVLDDTKGNELIREHGQYDKDSTIEHDLREHVLNDRHRDVTRDETVDVGRDQTFTIGNDQTGTVVVDKTLTIGKNHTETVGSNMTITVGSMLTETVGINYAETVGAAMELTVGAMMLETIGASKTQSVGANKSVDVGNDSSETVGGDKSLSVNKNLSESIDGQHSETVQKEYSLKAKKVIVNADDEVAIVTGSASINMKKNGDITINGKKITIKGSGDVIVKGQKILQN